MTCLLGSSVLIAPAAYAQGLDVDSALPLERLRLSTDQTGLLSIEGTAVLNQNAWEAAVWFGWSKNPLVIRENGQRAAALVGNRVGAGLVGAIGLGGWAQLGFEMPFVLYQDRWGVDGSSFGNLPVLSAQGLGSLRFVPKVHLLSTARHGLDLTMVANLTFPSFNGASFIGPLGMELLPEVAISRAFGDLRVVANLGGVLRQKIVLGDSTVGDELTGQVGAGYRLGNSPQNGKALELGLMLAGSTAAQLSSQASGTALEVRGFAAYDLHAPLQIFVGAGTGLLRGWGMPEWRVFGGVRFSGNKDSDSDGLLDTQDACPGVAGLKENRGCPDRDNDGDGLVDRLDACPTAPGPEQNKGCLDKDIDGDGLVDRLDACLAESGSPENKGCPDKDADGDGLVDRLDLCPAVAGLTENKGCPDKDTDGDGVVDRLDACPDEAGLDENKGCTDKDTDGDDLVDRLDACPAEAGPAENSGCRDKDRDNDSVVDRLDECPDRIGPTENKGCPR